MKLKICIGLILYESLTSRTVTVMQVHNSYSSHICSIIISVWISQSLLFAFFNKTHSLPCALYLLFLCYWREICDPQGCVVITMYDMHYSECISFFQRTQCIQQDMTFSCAMFKETGYISVKWIYKYCGL
jgi:hypothetical protein